MSRERSHRWQGRRRGWQALVALAQVPLWMPAWTGPATASVTGQVLDLRGTAARVEVDDRPGLHSADAVTLTAWFRADDLAGWQALLWKGDLPDTAPWSNRAFGLYVHGSGYVHLCATPVRRQHGRGQLYVNTPGGRLESGRWHHVAAVLASDARGGAMRIYLDGELAASRPFDASGIRDATGPLWIGAIPGTGAAFDGLVDEVAIWHRVLTGDEIRARMHAPLGGGEPGLAAYYRFDIAGGAGLAADLSGGGHHGRLMGGARLVPYPGPAAAGPVAAAPVTAMPVLAGVTAAAVPTTTVTTTTHQSPTGSTTTTTTTTPVPVVVTAPVGLPPVALAPATAVVAVAVPQPGKESTSQEAPSPEGETGTGPMLGEEAALVVKALHSHDAAVRRQAVLALGRLPGGDQEAAFRAALAVRRSPPSSVWPWSTTIPSCDAPPPAPSRRRRMAGERPGRRNPAPRGAGRSATRAGSAGAWPRAPGPCRRRA